MIKYHSYNQPNVLNFMQTVLNTFKKNCGDLIIGSEVV
jgi:hypothetical protein